MNVRTIKGNISDLALLKRLNAETADDMQNQADYALMAVNAAKTRRQVTQDKIHALKYGIRNANRAFSAKGEDSQSRAIVRKHIRQLAKLLVDVRFELVNVESALKQAQTSYGNCRTVVFMLKSANLLIADKEQA